MNEKLARSLYPTERWVDLDAQDINDQRRIELISSLISEELEWDEVTKDMVIDEEILAIVDDIPITISLENATLCLLALKYGEA